MPLGAVVPVHNRRDNLEVLLASLELQTDDDFVLVVVDDGSTDGTAELLAETVARPFWSNRLRVVKSGPHQGIRIGRARNLGAANLPSGVTTMVMLDSDLVLQPDAVAGLNAVARSHPETVVFGPVHWLPRHDQADTLAKVRAGEVDALRELTGATAEGAAIPMPQLDEGTLVGPEIRFSLFGGLGSVSPDVPVPVRPYWIVTPNSLWPLRTFFELGGFDERVTGYASQDFALGVRMEEAGVEVLARPELWALHQWHPKNPDVEPDAVLDQEAHLDKHGTAAHMFMMFRRGEAELGVLG
jgi:GT2 family glycosyltransferase